MNTTEVNALLSQLLTTYGQGPAEREEIRVWARSGVEHLRFDSGTSVVFKYRETAAAVTYLAALQAGSSWNSRCGRSSWIC